MVTASLLEERGLGNSIKMADQTIAQFDGLVGDIRSLKHEQGKLLQELDGLKSRLEGELKREEQRFQRDIELTKEHALCCPPTVARIQAPSGRSDGQSRLGLRDDSKWTSSCFYSHPLGYKLCLALKSTATPHEPKPNLAIALVAVSQENNKHLSWPCEGQITLRIVGQIKCDSFNTDFSIAKPICEDDVLNEVKDWKPIPQEAIPFQREHHGIYQRTVKNVTNCNDVPYITDDTPKYKLDIRIEMISLHEASQLWNC